MEFGNILEAIKKAEEEIDNYFLKSIMWCSYRRNVYKLEMTKCCRRKAPHRGMSTFGLARKRPL